MTGDLAYYDLPGNDNPYAYCDAVTYGGLAFLAGKVAADAAEPVRLGDIETETQTCMRLLGDVLATLGLDFSDVVKTNIFMTDLDEFDRMEKIYRTFFPVGNLPARTTVGVARLVLGCRIEIECVARMRQP